MLLIVLAAEMSIFLKIFLQLVSNVSIGHLLFELLQSGRTLRDSVLGACFNLLRRQHVVVEQELPEDVASVIGPEVGVVVERLPECV